jgi:two-component system chemotaxis sensor kinase CheA
VDNHEVQQLRNEILTVARLNRLAPEQNGNGAERAFVMVIGGGERKFGLVVDKLVGEEELVIKPLDETLVASDLVSGASILGDGTVVLILNVSEVLRQFARAPLAPASVPASGNGRSMEASA